MTIYDELIAAGLPVISADENGAIKMGVMNAEQKERYIQVLEWYFQNGPDWETYQRIKDRELTAKTNASNIPGWALWDEQAALDWYNANLADGLVDNIGSLADAKVMLKKQNAAIQALGRMIIAIRDKLWPDLPEG